MPIIEWIASGFILAGVWYYGRKSRLGPVFSMAGCLLWLCIGVMGHMWSLAVLNAILFATNTYNLAAWCRGQKHVELTEEEARYRAQALCVIGRAGGGKFEFATMQNPKSWEPDSSNGSASIQQIADTKPDAEMDRTRMIEQRELARARLAARMEAAEALRSPLPRTGINGVLPLDGGSSLSASCPPPEPTS